MSSSSSSSLVQCPVCGKNVAEWLINSHLDSDCESTTTGSPAKKPKLDHPVAQPPPVLLQQSAYPHDHLTAVDTAPVIVSAASDKLKADLREPLAERIRPQSLNDFFGQRELVGPDTLLRELIGKDKVPSLILWGPPGSGKTTLAKIISQCTNAHFVGISAVTNSVTDVKKIAQEASGRRLLGGQRTILFVDEIHRFNKLQQDAMLPMVEKGLVTLIGATTENVHPPLDPSFSPLV